jgi:hypothetical protein
MTGVADAIRAKKAMTGPIPAARFAAEISSIPTGDLSEQLTEIISQTYSGAIIGLRHSALLPDMDFDNAGHTGFVSLETHDALMAHADGLIEITESTGKGEIYDG